MGSAAGWSALWSICCPLRGTASHSLGGLRGQRAAAIAYISRLLPRESLDAVAAECSTGPLSADRRD